jgi:hypothetical protein
MDIIQILFLQFAIIATALFQNKQTEVGAPGGAIPKPPITRFQLDSNQVNQMRKHTRNCTHCLSSFSLIHIIENSISKLSRSFGQKLFRQDISNVFEITCKGKIYKSKLFSMDPRRIKSFPFCCRTMCSCGITQR